MKSHPYQDIDTMHYHVSVAIYVYEESDAEATNHGADIVGQKVLLCLREFIIRQSNLAFW